MAELKRALELEQPPIAASKLLAKIEIATNIRQDRGSKLMHPCWDQECERIFLLARAYKAIGDRDKMSRAIREYKLNTQFGEAQHSLDRHNDENTQLDKGKTQRWRSSLNGNGDEGRSRE